VEVNEEEKGEVSTHMYSSVLESTHMNIQTHMKSKEVKGVEKNK